MKRVVHRKNQTLDSEIQDLCYRSGELAVVHFSESVIACAQSLFPTYGERDASDFSILAHGQVNGMPLKKDITLSQQRYWIGGHMYRLLCSLHYEDRKNSRRAWWGHLVEHEAYKTRAIPFVK